MSWVGRIKYYTFDRVERSLATLGLISGGYTAAKVGYRVWKRTPPALKPSSEKKV
jgi:hypothetical protein